MIIYSIYKATNIVNKKVYIGFSKNPIGRISTHEKSKKKDPFHCAIRKYGVQNFVWEIIYQSTDCNHTLNSMEPYFIKEFNSFVEFENSNGYNSTTGGCKKYGHTNSSKLKISNSAKLQWKDTTYKEKMILFNKTKWNNPVFLQNKKLGWEIKDPNNSIIYCLNLAKFSRENNLDNGSMTAVSKGNRKHHKGYVCKRITLDDVIYKKCVDRF